MVLDDVITDVKRATSSNQWINSGEVIRWFKNLEDKSSLTFFKFDVVSFYPSIKKSLFDKTISWAKQYTTLTEDQLSVIENSRKSFLFLDETPWIKKSNAKFDVTMGSYDGAEVCQLVGIFILHNLEKIIDQKYVSLYRDDGLAVVKGSGPELEKLRKKTFQIFKSLGLKVTIEENRFSRYSF